MKYQFSMFIMAAIRIVCGRIYCRYAAVKTWFIKKVWGIDAGRGCRFEGRTIISTRERGQIVLGDCVVFNSRPLGNLAGLSRPTIIDCHAQGAKLTCGDNSGFSSAVINCRASITIGRNVKVGADVRIYDNDFHSLEPQFRCSGDDANHIRAKPIVIEDDVFIGAGAIILKGARIGARSIVAAGSVVFGGEIPPDSLVKGNPAKVIKFRFSEPIIQKLLKIDYSKLNQETILNNIPELYTELTDENVDEILSKLDFV